MRKSGKSTDIYRKPATVMKEVRPLLSISCTLFSPPCGFHPNSWNGVVVPGRILLLRSLQVLSLSQGYGTILRNSETWHRSSLLINKLWSLATSLLFFPWITPISRSCRIKVDKMKTTTKEVTNGQQRWGCSCVSPPRRTMFSPSITRSIPCLTTFFPAKIFF